MIMDIDVSDAGHMPTNPGAAGLGLDGTNPVKSPDDARGYNFMESFHEQLEPGIPGALLVASHLKKTASKEESKTQFAEFLKLVMGELAATFIAAFKATTRPVMTKVPGTGSVNLDMVEQPQPLPSASVTITSGSRVRSLIQDVNDSDLQEVINQSWAQAAVWCDDPNHGYVYEVFVRAESVDKETAILKYSFVTGTKEAEVAQI